MTAPKFFSFLSIASLGTAAPIYFMFYFMYSLAYTDLGAATPTEKPPFPAVLDSEPGLD